MAKSRKTDHTVTVTFTRAEFMLWATLLDAEGTSPLAQLNPTYARTVGELQERVERITNGVGAVTDHITAVG